MNALQSENLLIAPKLIVFSLLCVCVRVKGRCVTPLPSPLAPSPYYISGELENLRLNFISRN